MGIPFGFVLAGRDLPYKIQGVAVINARFGTATFPFSKAGAELLFEVISRAYEHHSLLVTTNLAFEE